MFPTPTGPLPIPDSFLDNDDLLEAQGELGEALTDGDAASVRAAIAKGADIHIGNPEDPLTPLILAANEGMADIVAILVQAGANVNSYFIQDTEDFGPVLVCPLGQADAMEHTEVLAFLRENGAMELQALAAWIVEHEGVEVHYG